MGREEGGTERRGGDGGREKGRCQLEEGGREGRREGEGKNFKEGREKNGKYRKVKNEDLFNYFCDNV